MKQLPLTLDQQPRRPRRAALRAFFPQLENAAEALAGEARANRQEAAILDLMRRHPSRRWTPSEVHAALGGLSRACPPLTSIRRALTCLAHRGVLQHHRSDRRPGPLGARESCWSLA